MACATSLHFNGMLIPGMAARATLITLPQALRPTQTALRLCLAQQKAWVSQAGVLLTKHQQSKSLWPHKQADALLTKQQQAKSLWRAGSGPLRRRPRQEQLGQQHAFMVQAAHV